MRTFTTHSGARELGGVAYSRVDEKLVAAMGVDVITGSGGTSVPRLMFLCCFASLVGPQR